MNKKKPFGILFFLSFLFLFTGCGQKTEFSRTAFAFDTVVSLTVYEPSSKQKEADRILQESMDLCEKYDHLFSTTLEDSDIYRINHASGEWVTVSDETVALVYTALNYCDLTNGQIDITLLPVKNLWNFGDPSNASIPSSTLIEQELTHVDYKQVQINGNKIKLTDANGSIDLGFIAKGYIADQLKTYLLSQKVDSAIINLGGNVLTIGAKPDGSDFVIGIQKPFATEGTSITTVDTSEFSSVVTSGVYERYFEQDGRIYHHILDSNTGYPVENNLYSVTVLSDSSTQSDALSTTCLILGLEKGMDLIESLTDAEAIFITSDFQIYDTRNHYSD